MRIVKREKENVYMRLTTEELSDITQKLFEEIKKIKPFVFYASQEVMTECNRLAHESMSEYLEGFRKRNELR